MLVDDDKPLENEDGHRSPFHSAFFNLWTLACLNAFMF